MRLKSMLLGGALLALAVPALAQVQENLDLGALLGGTGAYNSTAGATNSASQTNATNNGALCQLHQISSSGTATITFAIQSFDAASATWTSLITSSSITSVTDSYIMVHPGTPSANPSLPTAFTAISMALPRTWRVQQVIGGSGGPAWNVTIGCQLLK